MPSDRIPRRANHGISAKRFACSCSGDSTAGCAGGATCVSVPDGAGGVVVTAGVGVADGAVGAGVACSADASASGSVMSAMAVMRTMIEKRSQYGACK